MFEGSVAEERSGCGQAYIMLVTFETFQLLTSPLKAVAPSNMDLGGREREGKGAESESEEEAQANARGASRHTATAHVRVSSTTISFF